MTQQTIENFTFKVSVKIASIFVLFVIGGVWRGTLWYNGIMDGQKYNTEIILNTIEKNRLNQRIIDNNQDNAIQGRVDVDRRQDELLTQLGR